MEDLPVGSEITLKVVEDKKGERNGCFFDEISSNIYGNVCGDFSRMFVMAAMIASLAMMIYAITRPIMVGVMDSSVNQKNVLMVKM